ncbi:retrovirus-related pol polyprotein from transposon TNT 1-94 [Tanacetum coccineum]
MVDGKVDKVPSTSTLVDPTSSNWARPVLTNARLAVEVFDGTGHFGMWQSEVLDALFQQGLDIAVEESKPEDVEERNWLTINRLACGTIRSCLSREQRYAFSKETSAYKLWVALEEKFLKKNCQNKLFMKKRLFRFTYVPSTTMNDHITSFNQLVTDLMNMDEVFKYQDLALILLGSLPEEYELLKTTLLNGKDDVSLSEVCDALYSKELRRKDKQISSSGDAEVLLVRGRSQKKGTNKRWRSKSRQRLSKHECAFCHEKVAEANVTKYDDEESDLSLATSSSRNASEIWLLDFACSHHITPHREWFSNFEEHEEVVYTADETPLTTHGIGSVRLQNEDGTIVTLKGVRYSPKLKKNLISVGTLESKGFEVRAKDGVMKIISGVLVVMKGIRKINNTYHYKGRTVVGTVAAVTDGDRNSEAVKLWHMRLGHAGEKSLNLLIKQGLLKGLSSCKLDLCEHCINGKTTRVKFGAAIHKTQGILDYVYSDVWGPLKTRSLGGRHYYVTFVDDFSRRSKAVTYACHLVNRLPSTAIDGKAPFEKWYGKPATDYDSLHVFASAIYYHVKESKLDPRTKKALFSPLESKAIAYGVNVEQLDGTPKKVEFERIIIPADREPADNSPMPKRNTKRPARLNDTVACASSIAADDVPTTYSEAVRDSKNEKWRIGISEEIQSLQKNQTWDLTNLPKGKKAIGCKWVYAKKEGFPVQDDVRYKGRLLDLELVQMDVKTAFLHGDLEEEIYIVQPEGFKVAGKEHETKRVSTPLASQFKISAVMSPKNDAERVYMKKVPYANVIGSLMYAMICTRPNISHDIGMVSRYMHNPGKGHWQAVKWILRYIHNTVDVGLVFKHGSSQWVARYCNSDYARDLDKRSSITGYVFTLAKAPITWKSTLQSTTALSTTKAEYMAMTKVVKEAIWLQGLLGELGISQKFVTMHSDSQSAINLAKNQVYHARTKHINVRYHFIREILEEGGVRIQKIHTSKNPADMLTKVVAVIKFNYCLDLINVVKS